MFKKIVIASLVATAFLRADNTQTAPQKVVNTTIIKGDTVAVSGGGNSNNILKNPEVQALIQQAYQKGYQEGADKAMMDMNRRLIAMEEYMDGIFNFHRLVLEGKYEPPKIGIIVSPVEVSNDGRTMSIEAQTFTVLEDGRFVEEPKSWRSFLLDTNK